MSFTKIDSSALNARGATTLDNKPQISASALKTEFDAPAKQVVAPAVNNLVDELEATTAAASLGAMSVTGRTGGDTIQSNLNKLSVDLAAVEQTSTQTSHTHSNKTELDLISEGTNGNLEYDNKEIPFSSEVVSLTGYVATDNNYTNADKALVQSAVQDSSYVHTDENYTSAEKTKLAGIDANANNYSLPIASVSTLGGVKVDGSTTTIDADGTIHSAGGTGGSSVSWVQAVSSGTKIAEITIDSVKTDVYAPTSGGGGGGTSSYPSLSDLPQINSNQLIGDKTSTQLGLADKVHTHTTSDISNFPSIPSKTSDLTNDSNFVVDANYSHIDLTNLNNKTQNLDANGKISASNVLDTDGTTAITEKIQNLDSNGKISTDNVTIGTGTTGITEKIAKLDNVTETVADIENTSKANYLTSAKTVRMFSNKYTDRIEFELPNGDNEVGVWQEGTPVINDTNFFISPYLYEADGDSLELSFLFDTSCELPISIVRYQYINQTVWQGQNCGAINFTVSGTETGKDVKAYIDVTHLRA